MSKLVLGVMASGRGSNLQSILDAIEKALFLLASALLSPINRKQKHSIVRVRQVSLLFVSIAKNMIPEKRLNMRLLKRFVRMALSSLYWQVSCAF